jgi:hypothetical protein
MSHASDLEIEASHNRKQTPSPNYRLDHPNTETSLAHSFLVRRGADGQPAFARFDY